MLVLCTASALNLGAGDEFLILLMFGLIVFFFAQWEEYHTHEFILGYANVTEAQIFMMVINFVSAYFTPAVWNRTIEFAGFELRYNTILLALTISLELWTMVSK
jgi:hypothetical protein